METVFRGVCTALVTPFSAGKPDLPLFNELMNYQRENGVSNVCVCGTTGEAATLSDTEQETLIAAAARHRADGMTVIAGTGSNSTAHAIELSLTADRLGVNAVLCVTPYYNKATERGLIAHFAAIADAVSCPVILYNVPSRTGVKIPISVYKELSKHPRIAGVKEASGDLVYAMQIREATENGFSIWCGNDDLIVPMQAIGAMGAISVLSNIAPGKTVELLSDCFAGNYERAAKRQIELSPLVRALFAEVNPTPVKAAMELLGFPVGAPRLPLTKANDETNQKLLQALKNHGIA